MGSRSWARWLPYIWFSFEAALSGCVTRPASPPPEVRAGIDTVVIVPADSVPRSNFATFAKGRPKGAALGALGRGAEASLAVLIVAASSGAATPYVLLMAPVVVTAEAAGGAVEGSVHAVPADKAREIDKVIRDAVARLDSQRVLAARVASAIAADGAVRVAKEPPADMVLEIAVLAIELEGCVARAPFDANPCPGGTRNPALALTLAVRARLLHPGDEEALFSRELRYHSPRRELARWTAEDAKLIDEELERAYDDMAGRIADGFFLLGAVELPMPASFPKLPQVDPHYGLCWLEPREPAAKPLGLSDFVSAPFLKYGTDLCRGSALRFGSTDSLQPLLAWEAFPRALDRELASSVSHITYDLRVWDEEDCSRRSLVYQRNGLTRPAHRIEQALRPGERYFWSVRARFRVAGRQTATPWSFFAPGTACELNDIPDGQYHRFLTPQ